MDIESSSNTPKSDILDSEEEFLKNVSKKSVSLGGEKQILYVQNIFTILQNVQLPFTLTEKEDIIKDIYEGGFKVWECTIDLLQYLQKTSFNLQDKTVMDLGCGHGLLGIYALQNGAKKVLFQDFNYEVLSIAVRLNLSLNSLSHLSDRIIFLSGEWNNLEQKVAEQTNELSFSNNKISSYESQFDVLMLSEVIYNVENFEKIANLIVKLMKPSGVCLLANKLYYFGVGGSMPAFKQFILQKCSESLVLESLELVNNKMGNKREIVAIRKK